MYRYKSSTFHKGSAFDRPVSTGIATWPGLVVALLLDCLEVYRQRHALAALDDRLLKDIGLSRCDVESEIFRPFWR